MSNNQSLLNIMDVIGDGEEGSIEDYFNLDKKPEKIEIEDRPKPAETKHILDEDLSFSQGKMAHLEEMVIVDEPRGFMSQQEELSIEEDSAVEINFEKINFENDPEEISLEEPEEEEVQVETTERIDDIKELEKEASKKPDYLDITDQEFIEAEEIEFPPVEEEEEEAEKGIPFEPEMKVDQNKFSFTESTTKTEKYENALYMSDFKERETFSKDALVTGVALYTYMQGEVQMKRLVLSLLTADSSKVEATMFKIKPDATEEQFANLKGTVTKINGEWRMYRNTKNIVMHSVSEGTTVQTAFEGSKDIDKYVGYLNILIEGITEPAIKDLVRTVMFTKNYCERMSSSVAAISNHDTMEGDLLKHSVRMAIKAKGISEYYDNINKDVLVASALFHDIGKTSEIVNGEYTEEGNLFGHIVMGYVIVREAIRSIPDFPDNLSKNILHCILSHHGKLEWGSPVEPSTREAIILSSIDQIDSNLSSVRESLRGDSKAYSRMLQRTVYEL